MRGRALSVALAGLLLSAAPGLALTHGFTCAYVEDATAKVLFGSVVNDSKIIWNRAGTAFESAFTVRMETTYSGAFTAPATQATHLFAIDTGPPATPGAPSRPGRFTLAVVQAGQPALSFNGECVVATY